MRKGISPIIATVLLILIAIATGIVIYAFATGWIGGRISETSGPQAVLVVETGVWNSTGYNFALYVRNDGGIPANITRAYITDPNGNVYLIPTANISDTYTNATSGGGKGAVVYPSNITTVYIYVGKSKPAVQTGYSYKIKLISTDGSEVVYVVRA